MCSLSCLCGMFLINKGELLLLVSFAFLCMLFMVFCLFILLVIFRAFILSVKMCYYIYIYIELYLRNYCQLCSACGFQEPVHQ